MTNSDQKNALADLMGINEMSATEKETAEARIGALIIDAALIRLISTLGEEEAAKISAHLEEAGESEDAVMYLLEHYPQFATLIEEEAALLEEEAGEIVS